MRFKRRNGLVKSKQELDLVRVAASTTSEILEELTEHVVPGATTRDLDAFVEESCRRRGVTPAFKGLYGFPACLCVAVNDEVVHGIPGDRVLEDGDIIGVDFGVVYRGWYGDHARTLEVGSVSPASSALVATAARALDAGIAAAVPGGRLRDIGRAVESVAVAAGYSVVRDFVGHGIGRRLHEPPDVPAFDDALARTRLVPGMVLCIEPMVNEGSQEVSLLSDEWTAVTVDGRRSAHFEHTVAITEHGPVVLSRPGHGNRPE